MAVKKSELYSSLWESCNKLRGGMDASQYKDYVLTLLFMKYVTDKYLNKGSRRSQITVFDKEKDPEQDAEKRTGCSFVDFLALRGTKDIGERMDKIIGRLTTINPALKGIVDNAHFNDSEKIGKGQEMVDKLSGLINVFNKPELDFSNNRAGDDDIIGDAYEYLMKNFASESGKSKGQFYTPAEVSRILAKIIGLSQCSDTMATVCDPACGSGSLLIRALDECPVRIAGYGQEKDVSTAGLAKMNTVLHNRAETTIMAGNTFSEPQYFEKDSNSELKQFDYIVANPPFSLKNWTDGKLDYGRFTGYGAEPPAKNGDYAWLLHIIKTLKPNGKAAVILPHGVLFRSNAEETIRRAIVDRGYIKGIIGLPANIFFGTGIPACIIVIDKENAENRSSIFMIDASRGFVKDGNKNRLREQDIYKIVTTFNNKITDDPHYARDVPFTEIKEKNNYNLNIPRYIENREREDIQNIEAHLKGGIPEYDIDAFEKIWKEFPPLKNILFEERCTGFYNLKVSKEQVRKTINDNPDIVNYGKRLEESFTVWKNSATEELKRITTHTQPKKLIVEIAEKILEEYKQYQLIDKYDVYQVLLEYWNKVINDDLSLIVSDERLYFQAKDTVDVYTEIKSGKKKGEQKVTGWEGKLIPRSVIIENYFTNIKRNIENLENRRAQQETELEEYIQEKIEAETVLIDYIKDSGDIDIKTLNKAVSTLKKQKKTDSETYRELAECQNKLKSIKELKDTIKKEGETLDQSARAKYIELEEDDIFDLLINKKWMSSLQTGINELMENLIQNLAGRIILLAERYEYTLDQIEREYKDFETKVSAHLRSMGF